jgi:uncharacterized protein (TIGR03663 family)
MAAIPRESPDRSAPKFLDRTFDLSRINIEVVAFVGLVLLSIIAHMWALGHMALHHDESIHAWSSWRFFTGAGSFDCADGRKATTMCYDPVYHGPSLYSLTLLSYLLFGDGDAQARLPEAIAGILLVASSWMLRPYFGRRGALVAGALLAFAPSLLYYTRFARHDGLMILWEFWTVIGFFRWLDTGRPRYLYLLAVGAGLAMTTHELYYILFFLFGSFLLIRVLFELLPRRHLTIGMVALLAITAVLMFANPPITEKLRVGGPAMLLATVLGVGLLLMRVWPETPLVTARALMLWRSQRAVLWIALGILATIFVLLYSTFFADPPGIVDGLYQGVAYWLFSQQDFARGDQPWYYYFLLMPIYEPIALLTSIGAAIYLFTRRPANDRRPTTNDDRPTTDEQQAVGEIETTAEIATMAESDPSNGSPLAAMNDQVATTAEGELPDGSTPNEESLQRASSDLVVSAQPSEVVKALFPLFLAFWFIGAFVAFSWAGEKMPWLVTHIALPGNLLAAWAVGKLLNSLDWRELPDRRAALIPLAVVLMLIFLGVAMWRLFNASEGLQGQAALLQGLIPLLIAGALIYSILTLGQSTGTRATLALCALSLLGMLAVYEIRATWMVVYDHPDTPRELLVYVQSSPDIPLISKDIHELAISQTRNQRSPSDPTGGHSMPIIMDVGNPQGDYSLAWPFQWYLRDMTRIENRQEDFFQKATAESFQIDGQFAPVVMVATPHMSEATRQALEANYVKRYESKLNWWFPEGNKCDPQAPGYKRFYYSSSTFAQAVKDCNNPNLDPSAFGSPLAPLLWPLDRATWSDNWHFLLYRELPASLNLDGREMEVWVRRDLAGAGGAQTGAAGASSIKLVAEQIFGTAGKESGQLDQAHGLAVDSKGNVYVSDSSSNRVEVYGPDGKLIREIGSFGSGDGQFNEPHGLAVDAQGNLYVADTWNARIAKFDPNGKFLKSWGEGAPDSTGRRLTMTDGTEAGNAATPLGFYGPRGVAVDKQGNVYITDTGNKRIVVTDSEGNFLYQWGHAGSEPGAFNEPIGLALDEQGNLYVADTWNGRVQVFGRGPDGKITPVPSVMWNVSGWQPNTYFDPFLAASPSGQIFASVPSRDTILYANTRGDVLLRWGGKGNDTASLTMPSGLAVGPDGSVYAVDNGNGRVLKFKLPNVAAPQTGQ